MPTDSPRPTIYQLKLTLLETKPPVWRRLQVPADIPLPRLHRVFQLAMGWQDYHLHQFLIDEQAYGEPDDEYGMPVVNEQRVRLSQVVPSAPARFVYVYDFGDYWQHLVEVEHSQPAVYRQRYPLCLDGERACPPEDVGSTEGFATFLAAIRNRRHPEHAAMLEWVGGHYDPAAFDLVAVNRELAQLR